MTGLTEWTVRHYNVTGLRGLAPGPMGNWLASAGLLRAAARIDPTARLRWLDGGMPVLSADTDVVTGVTSSPDWQYTPVITPWQSGGGWGDKDKTPARRLAQLRNAPSLRLAGIRDAIQDADEILATQPGSSKDEAIRLLHNRLPDSALPWLDAAVPLRTPPDGTGAVEAGWAPVAGTGGNWARWDLSTNYHAALLALEHRAGGDERRRLLDDLLAGTEDEPLKDASAGPYWPAASGLVNPWALVLLAEGLCLWGDSGHLHPFASLRQPWTCEAGPEIVDEPNMGEAWLPMWDCPMSIVEVRAILATRPLWRGKPATTATGMYASMHSLGWPRGITGFARYGLVQRRGRAYEAVLLDGTLPARLPGEEELEETLTAAQAAERAGIAARTWSAYVARGQAPQPDDRDPRTGRPLWAPATVDRWLAARPGQGARTDRG